MKPTDTWGRSALIDAIETLGGNKSFIQAIYESTGLRLQEQRVRLWANGTRIPTSRVDEDCPQPTDRHRLNCFLRIPDEAWWNYPPEQEPEPIDDAIGFYDPKEGEE